MRLDIYLCKKELAESREKAQFLIKEGLVKVNGEVIKKPAKEIKEEDRVEVGTPFEFVGRGGYKLGRVVGKLKIDFKGKVVADIGCSIGGFTDFVLKKGARKVYAIDIGDTLSNRLKNSTKVVYFPNTDIRKFKKFDPEIDIFLIDVTFLSVIEVLKVIKKYSKAKADIIALVKPPFEIDYQNPRRVKRENQIEAIISNIKNWSAKNGFEFLEVVPAGLKGKSAGQQEFFLHLHHH